MCSSCGQSLEVKCPSCGKITFFGDYCKSCGKRIVVTCPNKKCAQEQPPIGDKCIKCGKPLKWVIEMPMQAFTRNYEDNSTEAGFQFTFYCDLCSDGYKTQFIESKSNKKAGFLRGLGKAVSIGADVIGHGGIGGHFESGTNILSERFQGMSPEWHKEHEEAFARLPRTRQRATSNVAPSAVSTCVKPIGTSRMDSAWNVPHVKTLR